MARTSQARTIRIPVRVVKGQIEYLYGGPLPELLDCGFGEIVLPETAVKDVSLRSRLNDERVVQFLPIGTELRVRISERPSPASFETHVVLTAVHDLGRLRSVAFRLNEALDLRWRGAKWPKLEPALCEIPSLPAVSAESVNHACRLISEAFEPHRRSHAANVFQEVFVNEGRYWTTLGDMRDRVGRSLEASLASVGKSNDGG